MKLQTTYPAADFTARRLLTFSIRINCSVTAKKNGLLCMKADKQTCCEQAGASWRSRWGPCSIWIKLKKKNEKALFLIFFTGCFFCNPATPLHFIHLIGTGSILVNAWGDYVTPKFFTVLTKPFRTFRTRTSMDPNAFSPTVSDLHTPAEK